MGTLLLIVAILLGIPVGLVGAFVLLPIRVGATGSYREEAYEVSGWARAFAGLLGVVFAYCETGAEVRVMLGRWTIWQPKPAEPETESEVEPPVARAHPSPAPATGTPAQPVKAPDPRPAETPHQVAPEAIAQPLERRPRPELREPEPDTPESDQAVPEKKRRSLRKLWRVLKAQLLRYRGYWHRARPIVSRLLRRLWRVVRFRLVDLDVVFGADDPSFTGRAFGYAEAVRPFLGPRTRFVLTPDFMRARFEVAGKLEFSMYLWRFLWTLGCFVVRGSVVGFIIWRAERRAKRLAVAQEA